MHLTRSDNATASLKDSSVANMDGWHSSMSSRALLLDKTLPPNALRIGALLALGMEMKEITRALEIPRSTYYDAVRILGQRPRSR